MGFITTSAKVWRRENSPRLVRISQPLRRTTRRWASRLLRAKARRRAMVTSSRSLDPEFYEASPRLNLEILVRYCTIPSTHEYPSACMAHVLFQVFESREVAGVAVSIF